MKISSLQKGLVGHWTMSQDSLKGSLLGDKTPYENDGTINGATFTTDRKGKANNAMSFNGTSDYVDIGSSALHNLKKGTFAIWAKIDNLDNNFSYLLGAISYSGGEIGMRVHSNGGIWATPNNSGISFSNLKTAGTITANKWYYYIMTWDGTTAKLYVDSNIINTMDFSLNSSTRNGANLIGKAWDGSCWEGSMADVRIYNRALSQEEITTLYNSYNSKIQL
jgi:hypothetical protein